MKDHKPLITKNQALYIAHRAKKRAHSRKTRKSFLLKEVIIVTLTFCFIYIGINFPAILAMIKYNLQAENQSVAVKIEEKPKVEEEPPITLDPSISEIAIPKIGIIAPIVWDISFPAIHDNLNFGVVHYNESAHPGQLGNMFIVGHSSDYAWSKGKYKTVFALLPQLIVGDQISIKYQGREYIYEVESYKVTTPNDIEILRPTDNATLTLMTCWPIGTSQKRYVIKANLISPKPKGKQTTFPSVLNLPSAR